MEPNKFEENIRTKLEERELQPSPEAWNKLEAQLGTPQSSNKTVWYAIAASLAAILVVGSFLLKDDATGTNQIVEQTVSSETLKSTEITSSEEKIPAEPSIVKEKTEVKVKETPIQLLPKNYETTVATNAGKREEKTEDSNIIVEKTETASTQTNKSSNQVQAIEKIKSEDFIALKVDEVVASVTTMKTKKNEVTPQDVEALLLKAQRDITNQRILQQSTTTIDPASLLNDVESELERSFRDKVFDALGEGFNIIRTAVVDRNN